MKKCSICKTEKCSSEFHKDKRSKDGLFGYCKPCRKSWDEQYYEENKSVYLSRNKERKKESKDYVDQYKEDKGCALCPEKDPCCLDFHHRNPDEKRLPVSLLLGYSLAVVKSEIKKCVVVCANCHRKVHAGKLAFPADQA